MIAEWIRQAVSAGGTGNLTLGSADTGRITINAAIPVGVTFPYGIEDGNDRETGYGRLSASTTLVRSNVLHTLVSGSLGSSAINVTTAAKVFVAPNAASTVLAMRKPRGTAASGRRVILNPNSSLGSYSTAAIAANYMYAFPVYWPGGAPIGNLYADIYTAAAAGKVLKIGIAVPNDDWTVCAVIAQGGNAAADATGLATSALSTPLILPAGWYVGIIWSDGTPTIRCSNMVGQADNFGWDNTTPTYKYVRLYTAQTFGSWPSTVDLATSVTLGRSDSYSNTFCMWAGE